MAEGRNLERGSVSAGQGFRSVLAQGFCSVPGSSFPSTWQMRSVPEGLLGATSSVRLTQALPSPSAPLRSRLSHVLLARSSPAPGEGSQRTRRTPHGALCDLVSPSVPRPPGLLVSQPGCSFPPRALPALTCHACNAPEDSPVVPVDWRAGAVTRAPAAPHPGWLWWVHSDRVGEL